MNFDFLKRPIFGLPGWVVVGVVLIGGIGLFLFIRKSQGNSNASTLGQNPTGPAPDLSQIDPYTGVPYSIEGQTNPATGLPAYYGGPGVDQNPPPTTNPGPSGPTQRPYSTPPDAMEITLDTPLSFREIATKYNTSVEWLLARNLALQSSNAFVQPWIRMPKGTHLYVPKTASGVDQHIPVDVTVPGPTQVDPRNPPGSGHVNVDVVPGAVTGSGPGGIGDKGSQPYQATAWWPVMTDVDTATVY